MNIATLAYQAITTKYLSATDTRGARIKATCERGSITIPYPHAFGPGAEAHSEAVKALLAKFEAEDRASYGEDHRSGWSDGRWVPGGLPGSAGPSFAWVCVP